MPQNVTDSSVFTDPIVEPADADPLDATYVRTAIQGLSNRTRYLYDKNGPETTTRDVSLVGMANDGGSLGAPLQWGSALASEIPALYSQVNAARILIPIPIAVGETFVGVDVSCNPGAARATSGNRIQLKIREWIPDWSTDGTPAAGTLKSGTDDGTTNQQIVVLTLAVPQVVNEGEAYYLEIQGGNDASTNVDAINGIRLRYESRDRR